MKRIFAYFATFFLISTCASLPSLKENEQRYNAKMSDTPVQNLFDSLVDNQADTVLNNYSTVYFSNLTSNFPINSHGTWSHKPSNGEVRDFDFDGNPILDPEFCNRKSNRLIEEEKQGIFEQNYNSAIYYFQVDGFYLG